MIYDLVAIEHQKNSSEGTNAQTFVLFSTCLPPLPQAPLVADITTGLGELSVDNCDSDVIAQFTPAALEEMRASTFALIQSRILTSGTVHCLVLALVQLLASVHTRCFTRI